MDIVIKSFNRPYYLERCLKSIYQLATGGYRIQVLDDGTPEVYLEKISALFPEVQIIRSELYPQKVAAIRRHLSGEQPFDQFTIPTRLWVDHISRCSDIFLLLEDDIWLTGPVDTDALRAVMEAQQLSMLRLHWQGNEQVIRGRKVPLGAGVEEVVPSIPLTAELVFLNRFKIRSVIYRLGLLGNGMKFQVPFYTLYAVAAAFFRRDYWLYLWQRDQEEVRESIQLTKAAAWYRQHGGRYAKTTKELTETSYISSATNAFPGIDLDIFHLNHHLNEAWLNGGLDVMQQFPKDFSIDYLVAILDRAADPKCRPAEWRRWIERFKEQYRKVGCIVD